MSDVLLLLLAIIAIIAVISIVILFQVPKKRKDQTVDYTLALNYLLNGEVDKALVKLKETAKRDSSNIDAYVKIGDIFRDKGQTERAIKIHRALTVRHGLTVHDKILIYKSLVKDYRIVQKYDIAISFCQTLNGLTNEELWVQELHLQLLEEKGDWEKAYDIKKKILREQNKKDDCLLALYKVEAGLNLAKEGKEHEGRLKFREGIKIDKNCAPAYLYLADSYIRENRLSDALTELKKFIKEVPSLSYLAFDRIKEILFEEGNFGEIEYIYNQLLENNPAIHSIRFALADIYERKGALYKAIGLCKEELEKNPESGLARQYLIQYYARVGDKDAAVDLALEMVKDSLTENKQFSCSQCKFTSHQPYWHCPQCGAWNSYLD